MIEHPEQTGVSRLVEVLFPEYKVFLACTEPAPQTGIDAQRDECQINRPTREVVEVRTEILFGASGMLVITVADLMAGLAFECRHEHAVIIDEAKIATRDQHVAVLQISVSDPVFPQNTEHLDPTFGKVGKRDGILDVRLDHVLK